MGLISGIANMPMLPSGWLPVNYSGDGHNFAEATEETWDIDYSPTSKKWANAKDTKGNLWVWIPRFSYKEIAFADDPNIDMRFSNGLTDDLSVAGDGKSFKKHPAFTFGTQELLGIWVAKYAAHQDTENANIAGFKPDKVAWRSIPVNDIFNECLSLKDHLTTDATGIDSHMMKNAEWGAPAILAKAIGNQRPKINGDNNFKTGYSTNGSTNVVGSLDTVGDTSTTGNMTGIFDMVGNTYEYVASYVDNGHANLDSYSASLVSADDKYKDVFPMGSGDTRPANYSAAAGMTDGMMIHETSLEGEGTTSWKNWDNVSANSYFPGSTNPVFMRGGHCSGSVSGLACFGGSTGGANGSCGFRACFVVLNSAPLISGTDEDLGEKNSSFNIKYTVDDSDASDILTVTEKIDGSLIRTINPADRNLEYTIPIDISSLIVGSHTVTIEATDDKGATTTRTYIFSVTAKQYILTLDKNISVTTGEFLIDKDLVPTLNGAEMAMTKADSNKVTFEGTVSNDKTKIELTSKSDKTIDKMVYTVS